MTHFWHSLFMKNIIYRIFELNIERKRQIWIHNLEENVILKCSVKEEDGKEVSGVFGFRIEKSIDDLWTCWWTSVLHKIWGISWITDEVLPLQEGLYSVDLVPCRPLLSTFSSVLLKKSTNISWFSCEEVSPYIYASMFGFLVCDNDG